MKAVLFLAGGLLLTGAVQAQNHNLNNPANIQENMNSLVRGAAGVTIDNRYQGVAGSPYVVPRWLPATITLRTKKKMEAVPLKYDVLQHRLLVRNPHKGDSLEINDTPIQEFVLTDVVNGSSTARRFRRFDDALEPNSARDFVEVLHEGKYTLLRHYKKDLEKANFKGAYSPDQRTDRLQTTEVIYLRLPDGKMSVIKPNLKALQTAAPALATQLKAEASSSKRPGRNVEELSALLDAVDPAQE